MSDRTYRVCRQCGKKWNVSRLDPGPKAYVCPICDVRQRLRARGEAPERRENDQRKTMDLRPPAGGAADQGGPVPAAPAAGVGPAQRPQGEE